MARRERAKSMEEFGALMGALDDPEGMATAVASYELRPNDVIITPYGKCGTTWLQQTFHQLRTGGDTNFDDISRVVPWIEPAKRTGLDLNADQRAEPRGYKSHLGYDALPEGARYVVSLRDPKDALVSMFRFMEGWFIEPGTIGIADFAEGWIQGGPEGQGYWHHLASWLRQIDNPDVLILTFAQMLDDPAAHVRDLAAFCDIPLDDDLLALVLERSSLAYMLEHKDKFDDKIMRDLTEQGLGLPTGSDSAKVREGKVGNHYKELPADIGGQLDAIWAERITPEFGYADYAAVEADIAARCAGRQLRTAAISASR